MIDTQSPLENLAACAISFLAGVLFTFALIAYVDSALAAERARDPGPERDPLPDPKPDALTDTVRMSSDTALPVQ